MSRIPEPIPDWDATAVLDRAYHQRQFDSPYRSTVQLMRFVHELVVEPRGEALDVGCGAGANIFHANREFPDYRWTGVDIAGDVLFSIGRKRFRERGLDVRLLVGDFFRLTTIVPARGFDLVLSCQTLQVLPHYEEALEQLLAVSRGWLFLTGLFTDFRIDATIAVMDYTWPVGTQGPYYYSVYSLERLCAFCEARGAREIRTRDFEIDIDLPEPESRGMATYTRAAANGRRLQFSGPVFEPWKFVGIRMGKA